MLPPSPALTEYIKRNYKSWYRFARDVYKLDIEEELSCVAESRSDNGRPQRGQIALREASSRSLATFPPLCRLLSSTELTEGPENASSDLCVLALLQAEAQARDGGL